MEELRTDNEFEWTIPEEQPALEAGPEDEAPFHIPRD